MDPTDKDGMFSSRESGGRELQDASERLLEFKVFATKAT